MHKNIENNPMNHDIFAGQWKQMRGTLKSWWGKLSDDDFEWIAGQKDKLIGLVQEKYEYTRDQAQDEVERRFNEYGDKESTGSVRDMKAKVYELGETAASKPRGAVTALGDEFATAGSSMQENKLETMVTNLCSSHMADSLWHMVGTTRYKPYAISQLVPENSIVMPMQK